ncbi:MAG: hypothetical protein WHS65_14270 [Melioribacteraceae bacterium]
MAELKKQHFGNIKGTFGNAVFRQRNGKNIIAQKPVNYTPPNTDEYFMRINKFRIAAKISSVIYSDLHLREIWSYVIPKNSNINVYNHLISVIYPFINGDSVNNNLKIVPDSEVGVRLSSADVEQDKLIINLLPLTESSFIDTNVEKNARISSLIFFSNPVNSDLPFYDVVNVSSNMLNIDLTHALTFETVLSTNNQNRFNSYQNKKIFSSLLTYDERNVLVNHSSTFYSELS